MIPDFEPMYIETHLTNYTIKPNVILTEIVQFNPSELGGPDITMIAAAAPSKEAQFILKIGIEYFDIDKGWLSYESVFASYISNGNNQTIGDFQFRIPSLYRIVLKRRWDWLLQK